MRRRKKLARTCILAWGVVAVGVIIAACRQETPPPDQGEALYRRYCAACHGLLGKGDGPAADSLLPKPADLTQLAEKYGGSYPVDEVMKAIDGRRTIRAHGERTMPVWGEVFEEELKDARYPRRTALLKTLVIAEYLRTLQEKGG